MDKLFEDRIAVELSEIKTAGLFKIERIVQDPQGVHIIAGGKLVRNFCSNNYLGLLYAAFGFVIIGDGFFKPNISTSDFKVDFESFHSNLMTSWNTYELVHPISRV